MDKKKNKERRYRLSDDVARALGLEVKPDYKRYRLSKEQEKNYLKSIGKEEKDDCDLDNVTVTETNQYLPTNNLSAVKPDGTIMDIATYCEVYGIPVSEVKSYKLVTHTSKGAYYNIASSNIDDTFAEGLDIYSKIEELVNSYEPTTPVKRYMVNENADLILQVIITDTHIGMDTNKGGHSLYGGSWSKKDLFERRDVILRELQNISDSLLGRVDCVQVLNLGDFADGMDEQTVRKGHHLPQNMSNEEVFDTGVELMLSIFEYINGCIPTNEIIWYNVCNSNHSSSFDYFISQAFKAVVSANYSAKVINERKFIGHYTYGRHTEVITHGKDDINLKFGFKAQLDIKGKEKIHEYIKFHKLQQQDNFIHFHKGDSHQYVVDRSSHDFDFNSYLALSPSSGWVQTNFASGRSGFSIIVKEKEGYSNTRHDFEFKWNSNELK